MDTAMELLDVMNCQAIKSMKDLTVGTPADDYVMEPKLDGFRLLAYVTAEGAQFYTRSKKSQEGKLPHIASELKQIFPTGTILDGEIVALQFEGSKIINDFEFVQSVMLSLPATAVRKQETKRWLKFIAFDALRFGDLDIRAEPWIDRVTALGSALGASGAVHVAAMEHFDASDDVHEALVENGFEGTVVKKKDSPYRSGVRGKGWWKIKAQPTVDAVVLGCGKEGTGKFSGLVGSIRFGQPLKSAPERIGEAKRLEVRELNGITYVDRGQASGMDDQERQYITDHIEALTGTVIEVAHMGIFPDGVKMRHPQFKRFRPDKGAKDVTWHDG